MVDGEKFHFNMSEFIKLAHTVIDADDHASLTALEELKTKWETRFGKESCCEKFSGNDDVNGAATGKRVSPALRNAFLRFLGKNRWETEIEFELEFCRSTEIRPVIHGGAAFPSSHGKEVKSADAIADVGVDSAADVALTVMMTSLLS
ncbi:UNVERIFIED_CONTAM: hypothetical protein Sindi_1298900 [Sesamum indicum]